MHEGGDKEARVRGAKNWSFKAQLNPTNLNLNRCAVALRLRCSHHRTAVVAEHRVHGSGNCASG
jgi:hypothetical protein